jgi:type I restriction enzyme S subunit
MKEDAEIADLEEGLEGGSQWEAYPAYKDSNLEWVGKIPSHWNELKLKFISDIRPSNVDKHSVEGESKVELCNYVDVYYHEHIDDSIDFMEASASDQQIARFMLQNNDVIITKDSEDASDIAVPALVKGQFDDVICGYHLALIRPDPNKVYGNFLFYQFLADGVRDQFNVAAKGVTRCGLPKQALFDSIIPLPPLEEQKAIADFLDERTRSIDELIAAKQKLLDLLEEKRRALITRAVTRGLDPEVPMKDSGVEWLREVPKHWRISRLGRYTKWSSGEFISNDEFQEEKASPYEIPVIGGNGTMGWTKRGYIKERTIAVGRVGAHCGNIHLVSPEAWISDNAIRLTKSRSFDIDFFGKLLDSLDVNRFADRTAQPLITGGLLRSLRVPIPPLDEQEGINEYLQTETDRIDEIRSETKKAMERLKEYRGALISAMVTGKKLTK